MELAVMWRGERGEGASGGPLSVPAGLAFAFSFSFIAIPMEPHSVKDELMPSRGRDRQRPNHQTGSRRVSFAAASFAGRGACSVKQGSRKGSPHPFCDSLSFRLGHYLWTSCVAVPGAAVFAATVILFWAFVFNHDGGGTGCDTFPSSRSQGQTSPTSILGHPSLRLAYF